MATAGERAAAAEVLAAAKARTSSCKILFDGDLAARLEDAREAFDAAEKDSDEAKKLAADLVALEDEAEAAKTEVTFKVGRGRWRKLMADFPPSDDEKAAGAEFADEFVFAAMAEFLVAPCFSIEDLKSLDDDVLDEAQFQEMWSTCLKAYFGGRSVPPSEAARRLLSGRGSSN